MRLQVSSSTRLGCSTLFDQVAETQDQAARVGDCISMALPAHIRGVVVVTFQDVGSVAGLC